MVTSGKFVTKRDAFRTQSGPLASKPNLPYGKLPFIFRFSSVYYWMKNTNLHILKLTLACFQRDVGLCRKGCCLSLAQQSSLRFLLPPNNPFWKKQSASMRCMLCIRKAHPKKNNYLLHLSRSDFLPFTLLFFFRDPQL